MSQTEPGWYYAQGDAPGTVRYWDGQTWVGEPTTSGATAGSPSNYRYGGAGARLGARIIDGIIVAIPLIIGFFAAVDLDNFDQSDLLPFTLISIAFSAAYEIGFVGLKGATPGKMVLGLQVVNGETGEMPPGLGPAAIRWAPALLGLIPGLANFIGLVIAIASGVMISNDDQNRSVYDRIAKTIVVEK